MHAKHSFDQSNESDLWSSFVEGDKESFSTLYKICYRKLYSYGMSIGISDQQIRDIIQDIFVKLFAKPEYIRDSSTILSFLFAAVRNASINCLKNKQKQLNFDDIEDFDLKYSIQTNTIDNIIEEEHIRTRIKEILACLTPRQKEIIYLRFLYEMEYEEIARIMNISEQAARNLTHRSMERLRKNNSEFIIFILFLLS